MKDFDFSTLPASNEEAFIEYEAWARRQYESDMSNDRNAAINNDQYGNYIGSYQPERHYVQSILAFIDECGLTLEVSDISEYRGGDFEQAFSDFQSKVHYMRQRFLIRKGRIDTGNAGTLVMISQSYKGIIHGHLDKIRKIVNQEISDQNKQDAIYRLISSLASEVDRDRTTVDAIFSRFLDFSKVLGEAAGHIKPAVDQLERVMSALKDGVIRVELLPVQQRPKLLENKPKKISSDAPFDDEIPF